MGSTVSHMIELTPGRRDLKEPNAKENRTVVLVMVGPPIKYTENSLTPEASHACLCVCR